MSRHDWVNGRPSFGCADCGFQPADVDDLYSNCPSTEEPETYEAEEAALGSCGCIEKHMADCPTRG